MLHHYLKVDGLPFMSIEHLGLYKHTFHHKKPFSHSHISLSPSL